MEDLLRKDAIETVPLHEINSGFYSTFFLVPKKNGKMRPVINLRPLNIYLRKTHFKMDTFVKVLNLVKPKDWAISLDLSDAYLHIPIFVKHRKFLRFCINKKCYQFKSLCFGPTCAPRVFSKIIAVIAAHLREQNIRLTSYLDDWLVLNQIKALLLQDREKCLSLLSSLGFIVNTEKSTLRPTQKITYIGGLFRLDLGLVFPTPERVSKLLSAVNNILTNQVTAQDFLHLLGVNVFVPGTDSQCSSIHEADSVTSSLFLETQQYEFDSQNSCYSTSEISSEMVVRFSKHFEGQIFTTVSNKYNHNDRCFEFWIWRACDESVCSGYMVSSSEEVAYQFSGVGSSVPDFETFSSNIAGSECTDTIGQYDGSSVHQQTGGHTITSLVLQDLGSVELGDSEQYSDQSSPYFRQTQCLGRSAEQEQSFTHRMDIEQISSAEAVQSVGLAIDRSVCFSRESTDSDILFLVTSSSSIGTRRAVNLVGEHVCLCISPNLSHSQSSSAYEAISVPGDPDSSTVAQETLVHRPSSTSSGLSKKTSNSVKSITSAKKQDKSPKSRGVQLDCLASLNRNFKEKGFSKQARQLLTASWRKGTQKDYTSKFKKFCSWCHTRQIDPHSASLIQVADFLSGLFNSGLQYRTIAGYRSMLSSVLSPINNVPVGQHPHIIRLLKGVFNSRNCCQNGTCN